MKKNLNGQSLQDFQKGVVDKELLILRRKLAKNYGYDVNAFDNYSSIPKQLVEVYDWLFYFGFGEVLSDDFVKNIKTNIIKEALSNMSINLGNVTNDNVRDQMSGLWFDEQEIQNLKQENAKLEKRNSELAERVSQNNELLNEIRNLLNHVDNTNKKPEEIMLTNASIVDRLKELVNKKSS